MQFLVTSLQLDRRQPFPLYLQIANGIIGQIRTGIIKPRTRLPGSRKLATALSLHRQTVVMAYDELAAQGWVVIQARKFVQVASHLPDVKPKPFAVPGGQKDTRQDIPYQFNEAIVLPPYHYKQADGKNLTFDDGFPDTRLAPTDLLMREYRRVANYRFTGDYLMYGNAQGSLNLRVQLSKFLYETRGLKVSPEAILVTRGVQMAIYLSAQLIISKDDVVVAADPGYFRANEVFEQAGARLELVPVDENGIDTDVIAQLCLHKKVQAVYVIPHHHRPTGATLSPERRMQLLKLATKYKFAIIEDDYDYDFRYATGPVLPLQSADENGSVIYVGSFGKTIAPGIRLGFMVGPEELICRATRLRRMIDLQGDRLMEEAMANLLKNGDIQRHLRKANKIYNERRDTLCTLLRERLADHISFKVPAGGFAIWIKYKDHLDPEKIAESAARAGLNISKGRSYFYDKRINDRHIRVGFASLTSDELHSAIDRLVLAIEKSITV